MELISGLALVVLSILSFWYGYFKYSFQYWKSRGVLCDEPSIPHGHSRIFGKEIHQAHFFKKMYDKYKPLGAKLCGVYAGTKPIAVILDLDLVKSVLVKDFANFTERGFFYNEDDDPLSANLFVLESDKWKKLRAKLTPTFTSGKMKFMFPTIVEVADRFRDCLLEVVQKHDQFEIKEFLARFTTDVIGTCAFGIECNSLKDPNAEFRHYGRMASGRGLSTFDRFLVNISMNLARKCHVKTTPDNISKFFIGVVHDTVEYREKNQISRNDFMDLLIKLKNDHQADKENVITFNELAAQAFVFFTAGFETSSTTLAFCLYELSINSIVQTKARRIVQETYRKYNGRFTYEMMMDMPYIEQILEETLRKYPPLSNLHRQAKNNYLVPGTDILIEKDVAVLIPAFAIQYDSEYYPNPEKFDPERFESEEKSKRNPMTWLPFGDGPRNCTGLRFGMMQAKIGLVMLLNNFEISLGSKSTKPPVIETRSFILSPRGGVYLHLKTITS